MSWSSALGGLLALSALLTGWVTVQLVWRRAFPAAGADPDALAGRLGCRGTCAPEDCVHRSSGGHPGAGGEEER